MNSTARPKVLMLGWEYPPHISGGLGTACEGLTHALSALDVGIDFVVPALYGVERAPHMRLVAPSGGGRAWMVTTTPRAEPSTTIAEPEVEPDQPSTELLTTTRLVEVHSGNREVEELQPIRIPARLLPYVNPEEYELWLKRHSALEQAETQEWLEHRQAALAQATGPKTSSAASGASTVGEVHYGNDLFDEVARYASRVLDWVVRQRARPDLVHAHDWMTFPAAIRVAEALEIPLVVHVHSLEQDRSGEGANATIASIEGHGVHAAQKVIAVSHYTARLIQKVHNVPAERIEVVHNGIYARPTVRQYRQEYSAAHVDTPLAPIVLFLGRITYQKGPDYFVEAAAKVLEKVPEARFVMAGSGDMLPRLKARVKELGIEDSFEFPGFVRGAEVERLFSIADCYVMPSVSEPFGISALEAMSCETPVILSRQSGASEVLRHTLKVDFWDISRLASHIVACLVYPELKRSIVDMAREEVRRVHWDAAAQKVKQVYSKTITAEA